MSSPFHAFFDFRKLHVVSDGAEFAANLNRLEPAHEGAGLESVDDHVHQEAAACETFFQAPFAILAFSFGYVIRFTLRQIQFPHG